MLMTILYTIKRNFRDKNTLMLSMFFPILIIFILGSALNAAYTPKTFKKLDVYYFNEDKGQFGREFDNFLKSEEISKLVNLKPTNAYDSTLKKIENGDITGFIYVGKDFTSKIINREKSNIEVFTTGYSSGGGSYIIKNIVESFINGGNTYSAVMQIGGNVKNFTISSNIEDMPISYKGKIPRAIDYYAVTMLVMYGMYGMSYGNYTLGEDKKQNTYIRIKCSSLKPFRIIAGKIIGNISTIFIQGAIIILFTKYVYKANWSGSMLINLLTLFVLSVFAMSAGMLIYSIFRDTHAASGAISAVIPMFTFIAGGYAKLEFLGPTVEKLSRFSPNYLAQKAMFTNIYGGNSSDIYTSIGILSILSLLFFILASYTERRKWN